MQAHWRLIVRDLLLDHALDLYDPALRHRPGSWLRDAVGGLLDDESSRLHRQLIPQTESR